ncbi:DUF222 domain-containing protein [Granulicoccus phenolivorans]|uniref:DUF222 domain-containing protein n=1 Tax=Granulicoccus phenolivorans TaxID=266854 RepID=UPI0003F7DDC8|nr:DUF222 domain-containing protein [Granulicoccus phenolivorans]
MSSIVLWDADMSPGEPESLDDAFAAIDHGIEQQRAGEVAQVVGIAAACDLYRVDRTVLLAGCERVFAGGSDGTPLIGEFLAAELGPRLRVSTAEAAARIAFVLNLRHRHPVLWGRVVAGEVAPWQARIVTERARELSLADCAAIDAPVAGALVRLPFGRALREVDRLVIGADPELAAQQVEQARAVREVRVSRVERGHVDVWARLGAADGVALDTALGRIAEALPAGDGSTLGQRRAQALGLLARNALGSSALPEGLPLGPGDTFDQPVVRGTRRAELVVHLTGRVDAGSGGIRVDPTVDLDRFGTVLTDQLGEVLRGCHIRVHPVLDVARAEPVDGYRPPAWLRRVIEAQMPFDMAPYSTTPARRCELDHTIPYVHDAPPGCGQTRVGNLAPLSQRAHRVKTHGGWLVEQPEPGVLCWTSPIGYQYTVTREGTTAHPFRAIVDRSAA